MRRPRRSQCRRRRLLQPPRATPTPGSMRAGLRGPIRDVRRRSTNVAPCSEATESGEGTAVSPRKGKTGESAREGKVCARARCGGKMTVPSLSKLASETQKTQLTWPSGARRLRKKLWSYSHVRPCALHLKQAICYYTRESWPKVF